MQSVVGDNSPAKIQTARAGLVGTPLGAIIVAGALLIALLLPWVSIPAFTARQSLNYFELLKYVPRIARFSGSEANALYIPLVSLAFAVVAVLLSQARSLVLGMGGLIGLVGAGWIYSLLSSRVSIVGFHLNLSGMLDIGFWVYGIASAVALASLAAGSRGRYVLIAAAITLLDQAMKLFVISSLGMERLEIVAIPGILSFHVIKNTGAAFGLFQSLGPMLAVVTVVMITLGYQLVRSERDPWLLAPLSFVLGGAVGNLLDRLLREGVIDFIEVFSSSIRFPLFNLADIAITAGTIGILIYSVTKRNSESADSRCETETHVSDSV